MTNDEVIPIDINEEITTTTNCSHDCHSCKVYKLNPSTGPSGPYYVTHLGVTGVTGCTGPTGYSGDIIYQTPTSIPKQIKPINRIRTIDRRTQWLIMRRF